MLALPRADFVTIHCPKTPETVGFFNAAKLKLMKPTAYLINSSRGPLVDEAALIEARRAAEAANQSKDRFLAVLESGGDGETYNLAAGNARTNREIAKRLVALCGRAFDTHVRHVIDRPGHDRRYALDA